MARVGLLISVLALVLFPTSCTQEDRLHVEVSSFGALPDGREVELYTLRNDTGGEVSIMTYGAAIVSLMMPDREGILDDVVLGFDSLEGYLSDENPYFGTIAGRFANRIARGQFVLDEVEYVLARNNGLNHLHGGDVGFDKALWEGSVSMHSDTAASVTFSYLSADGEEGYPGNLSVSVNYTFTAENRLVVDYEATTDKATPINLTQGSYFNLSGEGNGDILGHELQINASHFTPVDSTSIPTGEILPVAQTPFDFKTAAMTIGERVGEPDTQLLIGNGYDHNFVIDKDSTEEMAWAATAFDPVSGRTMEVHTTEPGVFLYVGNWLSGSFEGKSGHEYPRFGGFCLETQHFPDSPNQPNFPSTILRPGEHFSSRTEFVFGSRPVSREE